MSQPKEYEGRRVTVSFQPVRCLHAAECLRGLPQVFDLDERPWVRPDGAAAERVAEVVRRCPSGALQYRLPDGPAETPDRPTTVTRTATGQLVMRGDLDIRTAYDGRRETRVALCGCGASGHQPYCDHSGPCAAH
ncbi:(4Fe-4S)-binding protein [Streptomyces sp. NBC_01142]|uniref:(4Fe-4S)-binding protein n=1 Tax=Streptomyces sp. NBC_01142 TaxID=2975865 RepID=UPI002256BD1E|nr:(4Fe-4S)-binding protein [Streptomyces sp. NBC_01142]MCX4820637.1 (4Fe-4S)-binding protein [Streptomyces sp. NBC_01142]